MAPKKSGLASQSCFEATDWTSPVDSISAPGTGPEPGSNVAAARYREAVEISFGPDCASCQVSTVRVRRAGLQFLCAKCGRIVLGAVPA